MAPDLEVEQIAIEMFTDHVKPGCVFFPLIEDVVWTGVEGDIGFLKVDNQLTIAEMTNAEEALTEGLG